MSAKRELGGVRVQIARAGMLWEILAMQATPVVKGVLMSIRPCGVQGAATQSWLAHRVGEGFQRGGLHKVAAVDGQIRVPVLGNGATHALIFSSYAIPGSS